MADLIEKKNRSRADFSVTVLTLILSLFGVAMVLSASYPLAVRKGREALYFAKRQGLFLLLGICLFLLFGSHIPGKTYKAFL